MVAVWQTMPYTLSDFAGFVRAAMELYKQVTIVHAYSAVLSLYTFSGFIDT